MSSSRRSASVVTTYRFRERFTHLSRDSRIVGVLDSANTGREEPKSGRSLRSPRTSGRSAPRSMGGLLKPFLNRPRQFLLPPQLDVSVVVGHVDAAVARDLAGLDRAGAHLLPPSDVGTPEGVQTEAREVMFDCSCRNFECLPNARVPHGPLRVVLLLEEPLMRLRDVLLRNPILVAGNQGPEGEYPPAVLGFRAVHVASAVALLDVKGTLLQIEVVQREAEPLRDARARGEAGFADEQVRIVKPGQDLHGLLFTQDLLGPDHPPAAEPDASHRGR